MPGQVTWVAARKLDIPGQVTWVGISQARHPRSGHLGGHLAVTHMPGQATWVGISNARQARPGHLTTHVVAATRAPG